MRSSVMLELSCRNREPRYRRIVVENGDLSGNRCDPGAARLKGNCPRQVDQMIVRHRKTKRRVGLPGGNFHRRWERELIGRRGGEAQRERVRGRKREHRMPGMR